MNRKVTDRQPPRLDDDALTADVSSLTDEQEVADAVVRGDFAALDLELVVLRRCRVEAAVFTGTRFIRATFVDCVLVDSELSGAVLDDCRLDRVELRRCRLSGVQAQGSQFTDVALLDSKAAGGNFRMTTWERSEFVDCEMAESDFYAARLPKSRLRGCNLTEVELSKCDLTGSRLQRCDLTDIRGGAALKGVTITSDQIVPAAMAVFAAMGISIDDESVT